MEQCEVKQSDFHGSGTDWTVVDDTQTCSDFCQGIDSLKDPSPSLESHEIPAVCKSMEYYESLVMMHAIVKALDNSWNSCNSASTTSSTTPATTTEVPTLNWSLGFTYLMCFGSSFDFPWVGTEGPITVTSESSQVMRMHKARCPKANGVVAEVEQYIPSGTSAIHLTFAAVKVVKGGWQTNYHSPLWVTVKDAADPSRFFRWCFNRKMYGECDHNEDVSIGTWHERKFMLSHYQDKHGSIPASFLLSLGVYADQSAVTTLVKDFAFEATTSD